MSSVKEVADRMFEYRTKLKIRHPSTPLYTVEFAYLNGQFLERLHVLTPEGIEFLDKCKEYLREHI